MEGGYGNFEKNGVVLAGMTTETEKISVPTFLSMFKKFSASDKVKIAEQIDRETFEVRWKRLDAELPDVVMSDNEIMEEVRAVRYTIGERRGPDDTSKTNSQIP